MNCSDHQFERHTKHFVTCL